MQESHAVHTSFREQMPHLFIESEPIHHLVLHLGLVKLLIS